MEAYDASPAERHIHCRTRVGDWARLRYGSCPDRQSVEVDRDFERHILDARNAANASLTRGNRPWSSVGGPVQQRLASRYVLRQRAGVLPNCRLYARHKLECVREERRDYLSRRIFGAEQIRCGGLGHFPPWTVVGLAANAGHGEQGRHHPALSARRVR